MKTVGLIGGMSWESTASYYRIINQEIKARLGGLHSAKIVLNSVDFAEIEAMQQANAWQLSADLLINSARSLEAAGAECMMICTNTMHKVADDIAAAVSLPLIHIADATAHVLLAKDVTNVALLGTKFTMSEPFYKDKLEQHGIDVMVPSFDEQTVIHDIIYQQLCLGDIRKDSKSQYLDIIKTLQNKGAQGVVLGCTEIGLLISQQDIDLPLYDTAEIHAKAAVEFALGNHVF
jgi:aspartate racemase